VFFASSPYGRWF